MFGNATQSAIREAPSGKLVVFEGADAVGKSTLVRAVAAALARRNVPCMIAAFPGNEECSFGQLVHRLHHDTRSLALRCAPTPASLQALHIAAHADEIERRILPALRAGTCVLLDRFWWSTWVYGRAAAVEPHVLRPLIRFEKAIWRGVRPELLFLVTRGRLRSSESARIEGEYVRLAKRESARQRVIPLANDGTMEQACDVIVQALGSPGEQGGRSRHSAQIPCPQPFTVDIHVRLKKPQPTQVFETYWRFAAERQQVFFRRVENRPPPWTHDQVLSKHKFTNAYRATDRVSQFLIRHVIYEGDTSRREVFFRTLLFKLFNKVETWEYLRAALGTLTARDFRASRYGEVLSGALREGRTIYSGAYIMPTGTGVGRPRRKHEVHLALLDEMLTDGLPEKLGDAPSLQAAFRILRERPGLGDFLAFQYTIDLNYGPLLNFDEDDYIVPGPGARNGIRKCFSDLGDLDESGAIRWVTDNQEREFEMRSLRFRDLWGRRLHLIDCQNLFCEVDKYARVVHPELAGVSARMRIKQRFRPTQQALQYWFPPKWGINDRLPAR